MDRLLREGNPPAGQLASPKPQYKKPGVDEYAPVEGQHGAPFATLKDASGNVVSPATDAKLEQVKMELELVKSELATIKANQLSGDQKVQLSGTIMTVLATSSQSYGEASVRYNGTSDNRILDTSRYPYKQILIENTGNNVVQFASLEAYLETSGLRSEATNIRSYSVSEYLEDRSIPAGSSRLFTPKELPFLGERHLGVIIGTYSGSGVTTARITIIGGA